MPENCKEGVRENKLEKVKKVAFSGERVETDK